MCKPVLCKEYFGTEICTSILNQVEYHAVCKVWFIVYSVILSFTDNDNGIGASSLLFKAALLSAVQPKKTSNLCIRFVHLPLTGISVYTSQQTLDFCNLLAVHPIRQTLNLFDFFLTFTFNRNNIVSIKFFAFLPSLCSVGTCKKCLKVDQKMRWFTCTDCGDWKSGEEEKVSFTDWLTTENEMFIWWYLFAPSPRDKHLNILQKGAR